MARSGRLSDLSRTVLERLDLPDGALAVALSGGADSAACAWAVLEAGRHARALHVDHHLPGSPPLRSAAEAIASRLGLALEVLDVELPPGASPEGRARAVRYEALLGALRPGEWLLTAHTADDQAETVLVNLLRGSGTDGLAGIPPRRGRIARPLLGVWRRQTRELAALLGLPWADDAANRDLALLRNRVRLSLIPHLEESYQAGLRETLVRTAGLLRREREALDGLATVRLQSDGHRLRMALGELWAAEPVAAGRVVRSALAKAMPNVQPTAEAIDRVLAVAAGAGRVDLGQGVSARTEGPWLVIGPEGPVEGPPPPVELTPPGSLRWGRFRVDVAVLEQRPLVPLSPWALVRPVGEDLPTLRVRAAGRDDRISIGGGSKPVAAALAEAGLPRGERAGWPLVELGGEVVWVPGVRRAPVGSEGAARYLCAVAVEESEWETSAP